MRKRKPKPDEVMVELLREILQELRESRARNPVHVCPPCQLPHYSVPITSNVPVITWSGYGTNG